MHSNHIHPIAEADILTVFKMCAKTFVYSGNDDVFSTVTPELLEQLKVGLFDSFFRECPMALDAVFGLLSLGLKGADVIAIVMTGMPQGMFCDW